MEKTTMRCTICGSKNFTTTFEDRLLDPRHLPELMLVDIKKDTCQDCGEYEVSFPRYSRLLEVIVVALINKKRLLAPGEIRWLRSRLGFTAAQLAEVLKVSSTTISYWENGQRNPSPTADLALRLLVTYTLPQGSFSPEAAPKISINSNSPLQLRLHFDDSNWNVLNTELVLIDLAGLQMDPKEPLWGSWPKQEPIQPDS